MANIYQISQELLNIFDIIEENEGELTPELEEQLAITRESFNEKIKDYGNVVRMLQNDIAEIKNEKARLSDLQKSKEKTIERLKTVMIEAINLFGDTNKNGNKFVDYGTGKISIRTTQAVEIDEDSINTFVNRFITGLTWYGIQNQLDSGIIDPTNLISYGNQRKNEEDLEYNFTEEDLRNLDANIDLKVSIKNLISTEKGFELAKALVKFGSFNVKASANKTEIKREAKENHTMPCFATIVDNKSVTIK